MLDSLHAVFVTPTRKPPSPPSSVVKDSDASFQPSPTIAEPTATFPSQDDVLDVLRNGADVTSSVYSATLAPAQPTRRGRAASRGMRDTGRDRDAGTRTARWWNDPIEGWTHLDTPEVKDIFESPAPDGAESDEEECVPRSRKRRVTISTAVRSAQACCELSEQREKDDIKSAPYCDQ